MRFFIWIIIAACALPACTHQGYTIEGKLADANGMKIVLMKVVANSDPVRIDSCIVKRGKFKMKGSVEFPEYCLLYAGDNGPLKFFVENTEMSISIDLSNIHESIVVGSVENDLFVEFENKMAELDEREHRIEYMKLFAAENPKSMVTAMIVNNSLSYYIPPEELELFANGFDELSSQSSWVQSILEKVEIVKRIEIGRPFVDLKMFDTEDNETALLDYAGKGNYLLIDFWASWCAPCRVANPRMVEIYEKYKDKGFEIIGVSFDRDKTEWTNAIEADSLPWRHMSDLKYWQSEGARLYSVNMIRHTVLLDPDGIIIDKGLRNDALDEKLEELLVF